MHSALINKAAAQCRSCNPVKFPKIESPKMRQNSQETSAMVFCFIILLTPMLETF